MTFSIIACDVATGAVGVATGTSLKPSSSELPRWPAAEDGAARAGIAVCHGDPPDDLWSSHIARLADGADPRDLLAEVVSAAGAAQRQVLIVDARGRTAAHSGRDSRPLFAHTEGTDHIAAGVNLESPNVVGAMSLSFERSGGDPLWRRLLLALQSGAHTGGDRDGTRAARLVVYTEPEAPVIRLQVEDDDDPVKELQRLALETLGT